MDTRFGIYLNQFRWGGGPAPAELLEQARLAEDAGFDWLVLGDRRVWPAGFHEVLTTLAWLAAHTRRIKLATAGLILPLYPPVLLAEALSNLDVLSEGRLIAGFVLGYRPEEFAAFGVDPRRRVPLFERRLAVIKDLWSRGVADVGGQGQVRIAPLPVQRPGPPIWGAGRVPVAIRRTARLCDGWTSSFNEEPGELPEKIALFRDASRAEGTRGQVVICRDGFTAAAPGRLREVYEGPLLDLFGEYADWKRTSADAARYRDLSWEGVRSRLVVGPPPAFRESVHRYAEMGADGMILRIQPPGLAQRDALACLELLGREVLPALRSPVDASQPSS